MKRAGQREIIMLNKVAKYLYCHKATIYRLLRETVRSRVSKLAPIGDFGARTQIGGSRSTIPKRSNSSQDRGEDGRGSNGVGQYRIPKRFREMKRGSPKHDAPTRTSQQGIQRP